MYFFHIESCSAIVFMRRMLSKRRGTDGQRTEKQRTGEQIKAISRWGGKQRVRGDKDKRIQHYFTVREDSAMLMVRAVEEKRRRRVAAGERS